MTELVARGLVAGYGARRVLGGIDLELRPGTLIALVGPNGAGKSTLLRALAGLLHPTAGQVRLDGRDVATISRRELAGRIAVVPQSFDTLFPFTVREIVSLGRTARSTLFSRPTAADAQAVERALGELDLGALAGRRMDSLSGGERQRAVLAMALAQETDVLLLDEPTVHLDPGHQRSTVLLVRDLARARGLVLVTVLHDLNLAALADRIIALVDGRVSADGPPGEVLAAGPVQRIFGPGLEVIQVNGRPVVLPDTRMS
ncbi:MAG TPA: ABC transporter ATP-binding protein [Candidatus Saccharimonadales bacterium]|nr:ABC transporter ATP-binding protein [Candidatus Saccharimonadales bacterium]